MTKSAWLRTLGSLAMGLAIFSAAAAQAQLRVAAWNISNYSGGRTADIQAAVYGVYQDRATARRNPVPGVPVSVGGHGVRQRAEHGPQQPG